MKRIFLLITLLSLIAQGISAQNGNVSVTGRVTSAIDSEPLIGVTVSVKGNSTQGTVTDIDGKFKLSVASDAVLSVSYIGYKTKEVSVNGHTNIDIVLNEDSELLEEVVVVGYGRTKKDDLTGSVTAIKPDELSKGITNNAQDMLVGKVAGVDVITAGGTPGAGAQIRVRGGSSLNASNDPLIVIDGLTIDNETPKGMSNPLAMVNPNDIETFTVLKDASATAIYGSRASNGVIIITTKKGKSGSAPKVSYNGDMTISMVQKKYDVLDGDEFRDLINNMWGDKAGEVGMGKANTDWQDLIFRTAISHSHNVSVSGGLKNMPYRLSVGYNSSDGIVETSWMRRANVGLSLSPSFFDNHLNLKINAKYMYEKDRYADAGGAIGAALSMDPTQPVYFDADDERAPFFGGYFQHTQAPKDLNPEWKYTNNPNAPQNPLALLMLKETKAVANDFTGNFDVDYKVHGFEDLRLHASYGGQYTESKQDDITSKYAYSPNYYGWNGVTQTYKYSITANAYAQYVKEIGAHNFDIMVGGEESHFHRSGYDYGQGTDPYNGEPHDAKLREEQAWATHSSLVSYFGRLNYTLLNRYMLTATLRADGSSSFAKESRWGWFPSVALAWKVNNEAFLKDVEAINSLKLRLGWGVVGNQWAGSYAYGVTMASAASIWGTGFYAGNYPNRELKWEETNSFNVGLDLALFKELRRRARREVNNRIEFIADAYYKKTDNLLMQASLPTYVSGLIRAPWVNAGAMTNKGVEFTLNTHNIQTRDFTWTSGLTFSINHNEVTKLYSESSAISGINGSETLTYTMVGEPVGQFYGYKVIGMFKEEGDFYKKGADGNFLLDETGNRIQVAIPKDQTIGKSGIWVGDYIYEDRDNNGVIDEKDRTFLGNPAPKFTFGFNNYLSYKGFDLNIFLNGSVGNKAINLIRRTFTDPMRNSNLLKEATGIAQIAMHDPEVGDEVLSNVYVANADAAKVQRITTSSANDNNRISDRFVEDASYLRIKNISLGYTFPQKWLRRLQIDHLRLYVNIQNLCTITGYKGYDPEIGALNYNVLLRGVDDARYPSQRIYTFGLNFNF